MKTFNWGIIGLGKIANHFVKDLLKVEYANLYAVASRSQAKADEFSRQYNANKAYGSYEDLLKDQNIDIVYIATPHVFHKEHSIAVLKSGKAVLCEKPFAMNHFEVTEMIKIAREENQFLMEALWTNFMPTIAKVNEILNEKAFGNITHINANFCFNANFDPKGRLFNLNLGGGALLDIGIYPVYLALKFLGKPDNIIASSVMADTGVDMSTDLKFEYQNGVNVDLYCSLDEHRSGEAIIKFQEAEVKIHSRFHESDKLSIKKNNGEEIIDFNYKAKGYHFEIMHAQDCISKGLKESPLMSFDFSLLLIKTLDEIREKINLKY